MARIRTIKPEFWTDEKVVDLSPIARLLFIGLWNFADDEGRMVYSPRRIKMQILPADNADSSALLGEIRRASLITVYVVGGVEYLQINGFGKHQKIDARSVSKLPAPPIPAESPRVPPIPADGRDQGREGIKEGIKEEKDGAAAPTLTAADLEKQFWATAKQTLVAKEAAKDVTRAGALIGKWLAAIGPPDSKAVLLRILASAEYNAQGDFTAYVTQAIKERTKANGKPSQDHRLKSGLARAVAERTGGRSEGDNPGEPEGNRGEGRGYVRTVDLTGELGPDGEVLFGSPGGPAFRPSGRGSETGADEL